MKFAVLLDILFELLAKRKATAAYFAEKHRISTRTVYRYIDVLSMCVPVYVKQGRDGGICISDSFKLPVGFMTKEEYDAAIEALSAMYSQLPEERFLAAKRKLSAQMKSETRDTALSGDIGSILVDGGTWGDSRAFSEKLRLFEECIKERVVLEIEYHSRRTARARLQTGGVVRIRVLPQATGVPSVPFGEGVFRSENGRTVSKTPLFEGGHTARILERRHKERRCEVRDLRARVRGRAGLVGRGEFAVFGREMVCGRDPARRRNACEKDHRVGRGDHRFVAAIVAGAGRRRAETDRAFLSGIRIFGPFAVYNNIRNKRQVGGV